VLCRCSVNSQILHSKPNNQLCWWLLSVWCWLCDINWVYGFKTIENNYPYFFPFHFSSGDGCWICTQRRTWNTSLSKWTFLDSNVMIRAQSIGMLIYINQYDVLPMYRQNIYQQYLPINAACCIIVLHGIYGFWHNKLPLRLWLINVNSLLMVRSPQIISSSV